jgi:hypothetical protein
LAKKSQLISIPSSNGVMHKRSSSLHKNNRDKMSIFASTNPQNDHFLHAAQRVTPH